MVIDGIRHLQVKHMLEKIVSPSRFVLGYIAVDDQVRRERLLKDRPTITKSLELAESDSTEAQVKAELSQAADFTIDGTEPTQMLIAKIKIILFAGSGSMQRNCYRYQ